MNLAFALLKAVRKGPSPAPRMCPEPVAERCQARQPPEAVEVVAWTQPRSSPSRSVALSCCFHSECQPFAVQPKLFSSWGLAPPQTDAARASPKRSPRWESLESDFLVGFVHHCDQSGDPPPSGGDVLRSNPRPDPVHGAEGHKQSSESQNPFSGIKS